MGTSLASRGTRCRTGSDMEVALLIEPHAHHGAVDEREPVRGRRRFPEPHGKPINACRRPIPFTSFSEYGDRKPRKTPDLVRAACGPTAGVLRSIWTTWHGRRAPKPIRSKSLSSWDCSPRRPMPKWAPHIQRPCRSFSRQSRPWSSGYASREGGLRASKAGALRCAHRDGTRPHATDNCDCDLSVWATRLGRPA
jgi:hypothetical protein